MKLGQHTMPVICIVGDGDCYGEGGNHILHACRGNHDITVVVHDNGVYGLTTGQVSPRSQSGQKSKSTPSGTLSQGASFVAQGFAGNALQLIDLIKKGLAHKGFSLINVLQPCVTFNKINTYEYYREKAYDLEEGYDPTNFKVAMERALQSTQEERFPIGVLYENVRPTYTEQLPQLAEKQLVDKERFQDFGKLITEFTA